MNKTNMADQLSHLDDDEIEWTEAVSKNGVPFLVGVKSIEVKDDREDFKRSSAPPTYKYNVNWPVGHDDSWKPTSGELHTNFISKYSLYPTRVPFFDYSLDIYAVRRGITYTFYDESGDYYTLSTVYTGKHYVLYRSDEPTIVRVKVEVVATYPP